MLPTWPEKNSFVNVNEVNYCDKLGLETGLEERFFDYSEIIRFRLRPPKIFSVPVFYLLLPFPPSPPRLRRSRWRILLRQKTTRQDKNPKSFFLTSLTINFCIRPWHVTELWVELRMESQTGTNSLCWQLWRNNNIFVLFVFRRLADEPKIRNK